MMLDSDTSLSAGPFIAPPPIVPAESVMRPLVYLSRTPDAALVAHLRARGWQVQVCRSAQDTVRRPGQDATSAGIVDLDAFAPRELAALERALRQPRIGWIALTGEARLDEPAVRQLIRQYCFDYVRHPAPPATLDYLVGHAYGMIALGESEPPTAAAAGGDEQMVGSCEAMQQLFRTIRKVASTDAPVFIAGESGTGKELTAVAIHERSARSKAPFVAINCGAIPHTLLQSELFGYERGAFTGATQRKIGRVEAAHGGTLFLDEIGDMPVDSQAGLLRFLQEGRIERLGARESIAVDVRVLCATHVDLEAAVRDGRFRADLYHRLCVLRVDEPPLRERGGDIDLLARHVLRKFGGDGVRRIHGFTECALDAMRRYPWPGNVRELINRVRRAIVMADGRLLSAMDLDLGDYASQQAVTLADARESAERRAIEAALLRHRHRLTDAALELGISRATLYRLMDAHGLREMAHGDLPRGANDDGHEAPGPGETTGGVKADGMADDATACGQGSLDASREDDGGDDGPGEPPHR